MEKKKLMGKGLKALLAVTIVFFVLFVAAFLIYAVMAKGVGDPELYSVPGIFKYHLKGMLQLFLFNYANGSNIAYFALSAFLYALIVCWLIFLIAGILINDRKGRKVMLWGIILTLVNLGVYLLLASGSQKIWQVVNQRGYFANNVSLMAVALVMVLLGALYFFFALIVYFWSVIDSFIHPGFVEEEEEEEEEKPEPKPVQKDVDIRAIVREELIKNQPFQVVVVGGALQMKKKEEPKPKPEPEPVKEEPKAEEPKRIWPRVNFWEVAREVFPAFDNPQPLPKEEPKPVVVQPEEENDEWNRNKRQPFLTRIITADLDIKANYNEIKNEILSYGVKARLSRGGETFRLKEKKYVKIYLVGKTLKVYFALSPEDYKDSTFPIEDVGHRPNYAEMPLLFKVRSGLSVRRCKELVKATMEKDGLEQKEVKDTNWVDELRKLNAEKAEKAKEK